MEQSSPPLGLALSEGLGPLPKPDVFDPGRFGVAWREKKVRAYAAQEVAAERERWQAHIAVALAGIDEEETTHVDGWWETSIGAEFGAGVLKACLDGPNVVLRGARDGLDGA